MFSIFSSLILCKTPSGFIKPMPICATFNVFVFEREITGIVWGSCALMGFVIQNPLFLFVFFFRIFFNILELYDLYFNGVC